MFYQINRIFLVFEQTIISITGEITIVEVGHPGIWSRDINFWGTALGIYLHFLRKIRFFNLMSRTY